MIALKNPVHPGEILQLEFMNELSLSSGKLAKAINVPRTRIERIVKLQVGMTPDTALRLSKFLGTSAEYWVNLQKNYDLALAKNNRKLAQELETILPLAS